MYNPELDEKKGQSNMYKKEKVLAHSDPHEPPRPVVLASELETFTTYMDGSHIMRHRYGIARKEGIYFIENREIIDRLDPHLKSLLRAYCSAKKAQGKWKDS